MRRSKRSSSCIQTGTLDAQLVIDSVNEQVAQMSRPSLAVEAVLNRLMQFAPDFVTEFKELIR